MFLNFASMKNKIRISKLIVKFLKFTVNKKI